METYRKAIKHKLLYTLGHKCCNSPLQSFALSPSLLNLFVLASGSERNSVNATLKEGGRGGGYVLYGTEVIYPGSQRSVSANYD